MSIENQKGINTWITHRELVFVSTGEYVAAGPFCPEDELFETEFIVKKSDAKKRINEINDLLKRGEETFLQFLCSSSGLSVTVPIYHIEPLEPEYLSRTYEEVLCGSKEIEFDKVGVKVPLTKELLWQMYPNDNSDTLFFY